MANKDKDSLKGYLPGWLVFGTDGKSAYELAVENGYEGTVEEWLLSLVGPRGIGIASVSIMQNSKPGGKNVVTFTLDDGSAYTVTTLNGLNGEDGVGSDGTGVYLFDPTADTYDGYYAFGAVTLPSGRAIQMGDLLLAPNGDVYTVTAMTATTFLPAYAYTIGISAEDVLPMPVSAAVGQYIRVSAVDESGKVTATEAADIEVLEDVEGVLF